jgi:ATP-dependent exoDNAse (exonuclease V) alpha subunit
MQQPRDAAVSEVQPGLMTRSNAAPGVNLQSHFALEPSFMPLGTNNSNADIQVLCPMNRSGLGARSLNIELQKALSPPGEIRIERFGWTFCPGDKVMQVENDYDKEVCNGDLGVVSRIDMEEGELVVDFDSREVNYGFGELDELVLACATTIHKSQGLEYPAVVIPRTTQHYPMLQRKPGLHGGDAGQAPRSPRRTTEGTGNRC